MSLIQWSITAIFPFAYLFLLAGLFVYLFNKKFNFSSALPIATISATLFIFLTTVITHSLSIGFWLTVLASLAFIPLVLCDKNRSRVLKDNIFTPGFLIFCLVYIFCFILYGSKIVPLLSDASMHWAPHVWVMWSRDDLYTTPGLSIVNHGDYPPIVQLFELVFSKAAGMYEEGLLYVAANLLIFIMLLPIVDKLSWSKGSKSKQWIMIALVTVTLITIPLTFSVTDVYYHLHVDTVLGVIFAYAVYVAINRSKKFTISDLLILSLVVTFLCLVKQIALILAGLVVLIYIFGLLYAYWERFSPTKVLRYFKNFKKNWKTILLVLAITTLPIISVKMWSHQVEGYVAPDPGIAIFHFEPADTLRIPGVYSGNDGTPSQQFFSHAFIHHVLFDTSGITLNNLTSISYMQVAVLFVALMCIVWLVYKDKGSRHRIMIVAGVITAGWFLYCFVIYATFLFGGMKPIELMNIDTSNRYLRTYLFAMLIIVFTYLVQRLIYSHTSRTDSRAIIYLLIALSVFYGLLFNRTTYNQLGVNSTAARTEELTRLNVYQTIDNLNKLSSRVGTYEKPAKVVLTTDGTTYEDHYLQYKALPNRVDSISSTDFVVDPWSICATLKRNEYFIVSYQYADERYWETIKDCFTNSSEIELEKNGVYRIIRTNNGMSLEKFQ